MPDPNTHISTRKGRADAPSRLGKTTDRQVAAAQCRVAEAALTFVRRGLLDSLGAKPVVHLDAFACRVRCYFIESLAMSQAPTPPWGSPLQANPRSHREALLAFHEAFKEAVTLVLPGVLPPRLFSPEAPVENATALEVFGSSLPETPVRTGPPLVQAFEMASFNRMRAEQRIGLLLLFAGLAADDNSLTSEIAAQSELTAALRHLWKQRGMFTMQVLAMGALLGGEHLEQARALAKNLYKPGVSVIELLEVDGMIPSRYESAREDGLRQALDRA